MGLRCSDRRGFLRGAAVAAATLAAKPFVAAGAALAGGAPEAQPAVPESRTLGRTGLSVVTVGMGAMNTREADLIRYAVDRGMNYVDTADCYTGGENERIVGRALKGVRGKIVLATKVHIGSVADMIRSAERSLTSLQTDVIDILQLHGISSEGEVLNPQAREAMQTLVDQGKIRFAGVTTHAAQETVLGAVAKHGFYRTVLAGYNFRSGDAMTAAIRSAAAAGVGVIAMKTQAGGYPVPGKAASPHQAALAWVLGNPGVATTVPGMVSFGQVDENFKASGMRLGAMGRIALERYARAVGDRHCGLCGQCAGSCPRGVDVPGVLRSLTYREGYGRPDVARESYRALRGADGSSCGSCPSCAVSCRLGLPVRRLALAAHAALGPADASGDTLA